MFQARDKRKLSRRKTKPSRDTQISLPDYPQQKNPTAAYRTPLEYIALKTRGRVPLGLIGYLQASIFFPKDNKCNQFTKHLEI